MKKVLRCILFVWLLMYCHTSLIAQESIFKGLRGDLKKADEFYQKQAYPDAIKLYKRLIDKNETDVSLILKIANAYYFSNEMDMAVEWYEGYFTEVGEVNQTEMLRFASSLQAIGDYEKAIFWLQKYLSLFPDDLEISKRIWQLQNVTFLYEDSINYRLIPVSINTPYDEFAPAIYKNSLVFASNNSTITAIGRKDATNDKNFFSWYISKKTIDTTNNNVIIQYLKSEKFGENIKAKYHKSSVSFYTSADTMVFAKTGYKNSNSYKHTTQLFFANKENKQWVEFAEFPYNSQDYSLNHPSISKDGQTIYFVSDMPGGIGGTDIYSSSFINGKWSLPQNLGKEINTSQNESHPFIQKNTLYFSSDGHSGLGGLDIFSVNLINEPIEAHNFGYPINTNSDDFGLVLDNTGTFGYMVSNRSNEDNTNDDIFEVYIEKQSFPLIVNGKIKYKISSLTDSISEMVPLSNAKLELIDKLHKNIVYVTQTNNMGDFAIEIPYDSQFLLKVTQEHFGVAVVSMEMPKTQLDHSSHEIVIVKDLFKSL